MPSNSTQPDVEAQQGSQEQGRTVREASQPTPQPLPPSHEKVQSARASQFIPAPPQQQQYVQCSETQPVQYPFSHQWHIAKLVLYNAAILSSVVIIGVGIYMVTVYSYLAITEFSFTAALAGCSLIWTFIEFIVMCSTRQTPLQGVHPGAHVGVHLCIWIYAALVVGFMGVWVGTLEDDYYYYSSRGYYSRYALPAGTDRALLAFSTILLVIHFTLFVRACVETHQRNKTPLTTTVYVPVAMPMNQSSYGHPQGYYPPVQNSVAIPPEVARQMAQGGPIPPAQAQLRGYYAPEGGPNPSQGYNNAAYGYYAPPTQNGPRTTQSRSMQHASPSVSSVGPSTASPANDRGPHNPPTAPSPVSAS